MVNQLNISSKQHSAFILKGLEPVIVWDFLTTCGAGAKISDGLNALNLHLVSDRQSRREFINA